MTGPRRTLAARLFAHLLARLVPSLDASDVAEAAADLDRLRAEAWRHGVRTWLGVWRRELTSLARTARAERRRPPRPRPWRGLLEDVRYAARGLRRDPAVAVFIV